MKHLIVIAALAATPAFAEGHAEPSQPIAELTGCAAIGAAFGASTGANPIVGGIAFVLCAIVVGNHPELIRE